VPAGVHAYGHAQHFSWSFARRDCAIQFNHAPPLADYPRQWVFPVMPRFNAGLDKLPRDNQKDWPASTPNRILHEKRHRTPPPRPTIFFSFAYHRR
jgi:hypothetical protein